MRNAILITAITLVLLAACTAAPPATPPQPPATGGMTLNTTKLELTPEQLLITPEEAAQYCGLTRSFGGIRGAQNETVLQTFQDTIAPYGRLLFKFTTFPTEGDARDSFIRKSRDLQNVTTLGPSYVTGLVLDSAGDPFRRHYVFQDGTVTSELQVVPWLTCTRSKAEGLISLARERIRNGAGVTTGA